MADEAPTLSEDVRVRQVRRTAARTYGDRAVVIVNDQQKLHQLNPVGTRVWELADGRRLGDIVDAITEEFEVDRVKALADTRAFVAEMRSVGAIVVAGT